MTMLRGRGVIARLVLAWALTGVVALWTGSAHVHDAPEASAAGCAWCVAARTVGTPAVAPVLPAPVLVTAAVAEVTWAEATVVALRACATRGPPVLPNVG